MSIVTDTSAAELLDFKSMIPCEGVLHPLNVEGHVIDEPGAFIVIPPCRSTAVVQCKPRVEYLHKLSYLRCLACDTTHHIGEYRFLPL